MRRSVVSNEFGFHHSVALLSAKRHRLRVFKRTIAAESADEEENDGQRDEDNERPPTARIIQVEHRKAGHTGVGVLPSTSSFPPGTDQHEKKSEDQYARKQDIRYENG